MEDSELISEYKQAYNSARQGSGRETSPEVALLAGLRAVSGKGSENSAALVHPNSPSTPSKMLVRMNEDLKDRQQRRLLLADCWLNEKGRRSRYVGRATFTDIIDAFCAGGTFERSHLDGSEGYQEKAESLIAETDNTVAMALNKNKELSEALEQIAALVAPQATSTAQVVSTVRDLAVAAASAAVATK